jgi:hypothetical protein
MKNFIFTLSFTGLTLLCAAQSPTWNTATLNNFPGSESKLGTNSGTAIDFYTSGTKRMTLGVDGIFKIQGLADATADGDRFLTVDKNGNFRTTGGGSAACSPGAAPWVLGGNYANGANNIIGTCNDVDFVLKANNVPMLFMKTSTAQNYYGSTLMGIGPNNINPLSQLDITDGIIATWAGRTAPDHLRIYGDNWGTVESTGSINLLFQDDFTIGKGTMQNGFSGALSIDNSGNTFMGGNVGVAQKMRVGGTNLTNDMFSISANSSTTDAFAIYNTAGALKMRVYNDCNTHLHEHAQIGFQGNTSMVDASYRLNLDASGSGNNGLKLTTANNSATLISVGNSNFGVSPFTVNGSGQTNIGSASSAPNSAQLNINTGNTNAIDVFDGGTVNFRVKSSGYAYCRELQVMTAAFPDYVFAPSYKLRSLSEVESYINENKHLPGFENAEHYVENGINTSEMFVKQQEKIEELTLYIIALEKRLQEVEKNTK